MEKLNLTLHFQNSVIRLMLANEIFALNCSQHLKANYFENKYLAWFFIKIKNYLDEYKELPTWRFLVDQLKTIKKEEKNSYTLAFKNIASIKLSDLKDIDYLKTELTTFIKTSEFKRMHSKEASLFNDGRYEEAYSYVSEQITNINQINFSDDTHVQSSEIDEILEEAPKSTINRIPTGITPLDLELLGGLPKKSVTTVIGGWNTGKTIFSVNLAYYAALAGKKVLFIFHEGRKDQIVIRFLSRITGIPYNTIMCGGYFDDERKVRSIKKAKELIKNFIRIREMRKVGVSIENVYSYTKATKADWGLDYLIDDYGQKLMTDKKGFRELRHALGHIWNVFDHMSAELDIAVLTLAQLNRESVIKNRSGGNIIRSDGISEAAVIAHVSETILTLNRSDEDVINDKMIICLDKTRDGQAGLLYGCNTNFRRMQAYDPQLGFTREGND